MTNRCKSALVAVMVWEGMVAIAVVVIVLEGVVVVVIAAVAAVVAPDDVVVIVIIGVEAAVAVAVAVTVAMIGVEGVVAVIVAIFEGVGMSVVEVEVEVAIVVAVDEVPSGKYRTVVQVVNGTTLLVVGVGNGCTICVPACPGFELPNCAPCLRTHLTCLNCCFHPQHPSLALQVLDKGCCRNSTWNPLQLLHQCNVSTKMLLTHCSPNGDL